MAMFGSSWIDENDDKSYSIFSKWSEEGKEKDKSFLFSKWDEDKDHLEDDNDNLSIKHFKN